MMNWNHSQKALVIYLKELCHERCFNYAVGNAFVSFGIGSRG